MVQNLRAYVIHYYITIKWHIKVCAGKMELSSMSQRPRLNFNHKIGISLLCNKDIATIKYCKSRHMVA